MLRIGIIGIGNMGTEHCRILLSGRIHHACLTAVADLREDRRMWAQEHLPANVGIFETAEALFASKLCDAVIVAVPHPSHPGITVAAMGNRLPVLCEKPIAVSTKEAQCMISAAHRTGMTFALMFNQRTNSLYRKMKEIIDSGSIGAIKRVSWIITDWYRSQYYYDSCAWRATWQGEGGGVLLNQCPHQLDLLQWLCGMPIRVQAHCHEGKWHNIEVEDDVSVYMEFSNGATGTFVASTGDLPGCNRLEITGEGGTIVCEKDILKLIRLPVNEREYCFQVQNGYRKPPMTEEIIPCSENPQHAGVIQAFVNHILHGDPLIAEGEEGLHSLALSNAIHLSSWTGQMLALPIDEDLFLQELNQRRVASSVKTGNDITFTTDHSASGAAL